MNEIATDIAGLTLDTPNPDRDAPFAYGWFASEYGRDTLLKMGNAPHEITEPSLEDERRTIEEFIDLEKDGKQKTWVIRFDGETIGVAWIELVENHNVRPPSVHLLIGDPSFRGRGYGFAVMKSMINYLKNDGRSIVYSRHLTANSAIKRVNDALGFKKDGAAYKDDNGLEWQNIYLNLQ